jgi:hypothetical protein
LLPLLANLLLHALGRELRVHHQHLVAPCRRLTLGDRRGAVLGVQCPGDRAQAADVVGVRREVRGRVA